MYFSEKISRRLKRVYIGIAMGLAIWIFYASYLILSNAVNTQATLSATEFVLTPIASSQK